MTTAWKEEAMGFGTEEADAAELAAEPLQPGVYACTIRKIEAQQSKAGNPMVRFQLALDDFDKVLFHRMMATADRIHEIKKLSIGLGMDPEFFTPNLTLAEYEEQAQLDLQGEAVSVTVRRSGNPQYPDEVANIRPPAVDSPEDDD